MDDDLPALARRFCALARESDALTASLGLDTDLQARSHEIQMQILGHLHRGGHAGVPAHHDDEDGSYLGFW